MVFQFKLMSISAYISATATSDEDLIIWNFLPEDKKMKKTKCRFFSALPEYLDEAMQGYSLR